MAAGAKAEPRPPIWTVVVAAVAALVWSATGFAAQMRDIGVMMRGPDGEAAALGSIFGHALIPSVLVWMVAFALFWRRSFAVAPLYLAIVYGVVCAANIVGFEAIKTVAHGMDASDAAQNRAIADMVASFQAQTQADHEAYLAETKALGFPAVLTPAYAQGDPHQRKALAQLGQIHGVIRKYRELSQSRVDALVDKVQALPRGGPRDAFMRGIANTQDQDREDLKRVWSLEDQAVDEYEAAIGVLARYPGHWEVQGGKFMFGDAISLGAWRQHVAKAEAIAADEKVLIAKGEAQRAKLNAAVQRALAAPAVP